MIRFLGLSLVFIYYLSLPQTAQALNLNSFKEKFEVLHSQDQAKQNGLRGEKTHSGSRDSWVFIKDTKNEWRWKRVAVNGKIVGSSSEGYSRKIDCLSNAKRHGYQNENQAIDKWVIYKDERGEWRWVRTAKNGKIVGSSSEGYKRKGDCLLNAERNGYPVSKPRSL